ncbi:hypothetical protein C1H46_036711 [Malus baccata]|uniref:Uncharacterized protein n=1 Tax=Malus baccata TaxID=106549 RepID=A0A540KU45_MALBA|nr:hypothetical protein C1H46_036711 [Malus baccata]
MVSIGEANQPHAVCIPVPAQGHIKAMLQLSKLLHHKGFRITYVNTEFNHRRFLKSLAPDSLDGLPDDFQFETIPDGLPDRDDDSTQDFNLLADSIKNNFLEFMKLQQLLYIPLMHWSKMFWMPSQMPQHPLKSLGYSLWREEAECLSWLDDKKPNSVVYVNFGSITVMTLEQLVEFGWGLAKSKLTFFWVIRPDLVIGKSAIFPSEFVDETKGRSLIASWCPQEQVLNHPSVGGFLTHSGWNSTMESVSAGVPMLCWPFFADQQTNCHCTCKEWGIGTEIDKNVKRDEVEKLVRELMQGEKGKRMKHEAIEWKKLAEEATGPHGSSSANLEKLVNQFQL